MSLREREFQPRGRSGRNAGGRLTGILSGLLLILFGALSTVAIELATGIIQPAQLVALVTGGNPAAVAPKPAAVAEQAAPASPVTPAVPATPSTPATPAAAATPKVVRETTFGDWRFYCVEASKPICSIMQQLRVSDTGAAVFVWTIVQDGRGGLVGVWQVPETVQLSSGLTLDAGTPQPVVMPFEGCGNGSCRVMGNLTPGFIQALSDTATLSASVVLTNQQNVKFPLSAKGLKEALAELQKEP